GSSDLSPRRIPMTSALPRRTLFPALAATPLVLGGAAGEDERGRGEGGEQGAARQGGGHGDPSRRRRGHADRTPAGYASPGTGVPPPHPSTRARTRCRASSSRSPAFSRDRAVAPAASTSPRAAMPSPIACTA